MKINDFVKPTEREATDLVLNMSGMYGSSIVNPCENFIIRKEGTDYLIKSRYWNEYATEEANRKKIYDIDFDIISMNVLRRLFVEPAGREMLKNQFIRPGDNLIVVLE